eukprot:8186108-Prorocentrum_lima.AAC.1
MKCDSHLGDRWHRRSHKRWVGLRSQGSIGLCRRGQPEERFNAGIELLEGHPHPCVEHVMRHTQVAKLCLFT